MAIDEHAVRRALGEVEELEDLGGGGQGHVWRVKQNGQETVLKVIPGAEDAERVRREAESLRSIDSRRVMAYHNTTVIEDGDQRGPAIRGEYVPGGTVADALKRNERPTIEQALQCASGILEGVTAIHEIGRVHRDIKPQNIALRAGAWDEPVVLDLGLVRDLDNSITRYPELLGTLPFMAPEQLRLERAVRRTDVLPAAPHFLLDQPYQKRALLMKVGAEVVKQGGRPPGLLLHWGQVHDEGVIGDSTSARHLAPILASPGAIRYGRDQIGRHKEAASWMRRKAPSTHAEWDQTVDEAMVAQQLLSTAGLIVPSRLLTQADWPDGLQAALDAARRAAGRHPTADMLVNVIIEECWILDPRLRRTLLNQFTDLPENIGAAVHIHWAAPDVPDRGSSLDALRVVVSALAGDGRRVLLVETGRLGWLAIAWWERRGGFQLTLQHQRGFGGCNAGPEANAGGRGSG